MRDCSRTCASCKCKRNIFFLIKKKFNFPAAGLIGITKMASEAQGKVQRAVEQMLDTVEKEKLRPLLVASYLFMFFNFDFILILQFSD